MADRCTWDLTWVHLYLHMPTSCLGEVSLGVSTAQSPFLPERFLVLRNVSANDPSLFFFPSAGYGFLPSEPMETVARRQELIHKQNIAR